MEAKDIGKVVGAAALAMLPPVTGLYVYGKMKDSKNSTGASAVVGGLTFTGLGIGVALLGYYLFGLNDAVTQLTTAIGPSKMEDTVQGLRPRFAFSSASQMAGLPERVVGPFTDNFRQLGYVPRRGEFYRPQGLGRTGCCGR